MSSKNKICVVCTRKKRVGLLDDIKNVEAGDLKQMFVDGIHLKGAEEGRYVKHSLGMASKLLHRDLTGKNKLIILECLGRGAFGVVHAAKHRIVDGKIALKKMYWVSLTDHVVPGGKGVGNQALS